MSRLAAVLAALMMAAAGTAAGQQVVDEASVPRISVAALKKALDAGTVLVLDVRDADSYAAGHIPGAILVPLESIAKKAPELKAAKKLIVAYCG